MIIYCFLNNDTQVITPNALEQMLLTLHQQSVGIVGATLYYPDFTIQHAGMYQRHDGAWEHFHRYDSQESINIEMNSCKSVAAVTGACLMIRTEDFKALGGFDESLPVTNNDTDLCVRLRKKDLLVAVSSQAQFFHYESLSRGYQS